MRRPLVLAVLLASCRASSPDAEAEKFPKSPVEIVIDDSGVPHIYAKVGTFGDDGVPEVWVTFPVGNEADPESALTKQLNADYVEGRHRKLLFKRADVDTHVAKRFSLSPR